MQVKIGIPGNMTNAYNNCTALTPNFVLWNSGEKILITHIDFLEFGAAKFKLNK